jgi:predicted nucleotidyltransferase
VVDTAENFGNVALCYRIINEGNRMTIETLLKEKREDILRVAKAHGAYNVRVFGSAIHGDSGPESDIDFLVEFDDGRSLLDQVGLIQDLEEYLGKKVDVVTPNALHWYIKDRILADAVKL